MLSRLCGVLASLIVAGSLISPAHAQGNRVALLIGNSDYKNAMVLPNPVNDAADLSSALSRLGFTVTTLTNATAADMQRAVAEFGDKAKGSDIALIFFGGHAVEAEGMHWSIPVDGKVESLDAIKGDAVSLQGLLDATAGSKLTLLVIDTARDNPFAGSIRPGSPRSQEPAISRDALIFYSAKAGSRPLDGEGRNSPFVVALLKHIETPGLDLNVLTRRVRDEVFAATKRQQEPFSYGSLPAAVITLAPR